MKTREEKLLKTITTKIKKNKKEEDKMNNKKGISLITLVITIIIMIILAAAIVITLSNSGIFDKANDAVDEYSLKEVQTLADLAWSETFADGKRTQVELQAAVDKALQDNNLDSKYQAIATEKGVTVTVKSNSDNSGETSGDSSEENIPIVDLTYTVADGKAKVTGIDYTSDPTMNYTPSPKRIVIPSTVEIEGATYPVTAIGDRAFYVYYASGYSRIISIEIPEGVISIGTEAFGECIKLTSIDLPSTLTEIGDSAFSGCDSLTEIKVAEGNTTYVSEDGVLYNAAKTELLTCPEGKTGTLTIPSTVTSIGDYSFSNGNRLTAITVAEGNTTYASEDGVLYNYAKTELIKCPSGITGSITIPASVESILDYKLGWCGNLTAITVAEGNTTYASEDGVLYNYAKTQLIRCPGLKTTITIPASVTSTIYPSNFYNCSNLTEIIVAEGNTAYASEDGVLYNADKTQLIVCPSGKTTITIPASVTSIGNYALAYCSGLTTINIVEGNTAYTIDDGVLYNADKTELIRCPNGKTTITILASVTSVGEGEYGSTTAFNGCSTLTEIKVAEGNTAYTIEDGALYNEDKTRLIKCPAGKTTITIPSGITWLEGYDFSDCVKLTDIYYGGTSATDIYVSASVPYDCTVHINSTGPSSN